MLTEPMLACKNLDEKRIEFPCGGQPKFDGIRMVVSNGIGYARSMKPIPSSQVQSLVAWNRDILEGFDGELICGDPTDPDCYRKTMSSVMSYDKMHEDLRFYVFDKWDEPGTFIERWEILESNFENWPKEVILSRLEIMWDFDEINLFEIKLLEDGHEGGIIRNLETFYKFGRAGKVLSQCVKLKRFHETEARVFDYHELMHNGNEAQVNEVGRTKRSGHKDNLVPMGVLGALECRGQQDGAEYTVRIGTGFTQEMRETLWSDRDKLIGKIVKFKYFPTGSKEKPRFPVFLGFRHELDMDAEQLSLF